MSSKYWLGRKHDDEATMTWLKEQEWCLPPFAKMIYEYGLVLLSVHNSDTFEHEITDDTFNPSLFSFACIVQGYNFSNYIPTSLDLLVKGLLDNDYIIPAMVIPLCLFDQAWHFKLQSSSNQDFPGFRSVMFRTNPLSERKFQTQIPILSTKISPCQSDSKLFHVRFIVPWTACFPPQLTTNCCPQGVIFYSLFNDN
jgi:hypothetical protein